MKKLLLYAAVCFAAVCAQAQETKIPVAVYFPEQIESVPETAVKSLTSKLTAAAAQCGMGVIDDFAQFYLTCDASVVSRDVVPGAPPKYSQSVDLTLYVIDVFSKKIFNSVTISTRGIGNSEAKAYIACFRNITPANKDVQSFLRKTNEQIVSYYEGQRENIISIARALAKVYKYDEALFRLSLYPEACAGYDRIVEEATLIYSKYIDDKANRNLAKARAVWNAGQDMSAAAEAGEYLAEIMPEASCYNDAMALAKEIKARVGSDIDYFRKIEERDNAQQHEESMARINAWREVGVAFGKNQKSHTYKEAWIY